MNSIHTAGLGNPLYRPNLIKLCRSGILIVLSGDSLAQTLTCDLSLKSFRVIEGRTSSEPEFSGNARLTSDTKTGLWRVDYNDNGLKFACAYRDFILAKPNYSGTNLFYIISPTERGYPLDLDFDERLIWFAYCGRSVVRGSEGEPVPLLYGDTRTDSSVHGCRMRAEWRADSDLCPEVAKFLFAKDLFQVGIEQLSIEPPGDYLDDRLKQADRFLKHHENGQVIGKFQVLQWTDNLPYGTPIEWEYNLYWYGQNMIKCVGKAANIRFTDERIQLPDLSSTTKIVDKRVRSASKGINHSIYSITNGNVPDVHDVDVGRDVRSVQRTRSLNSQPSKSGKLRAFIISTIIAAGLIPLAIYLRSKQ